MLQEWARLYPGRIESMATAMRNVVPSHLADHKLFDFASLKPGSVVEEGDTAFDPPELPVRSWADQDAMSGIQVRLDMAAGSGCA